MSVKVVPPAIGAGAWLRAAIEQNLECLFTVAYLSDSGVETIEAALRKRVEKSRFSLRVLFQDDDLVTDPDALARLLRCARGRPGSVALRCAADPNFHAKAFGFKRSRSAPTASVIFGSANLTNKAVGLDSGELGVFVPPSKLALELWATMEEFWAAGEEVDGPWLKAYRRAYDKKRSAMEAAEKVRRGWNKRKRRGATKRAGPGPLPLWIEHVAPVSEEDNKAARRGRNVTMKDGIDVPEDFVIYEDRSAFRVPTGEDVLEMFWRSEKAADGLAAIRVIHTRRPVGVTDPRSKRKFWLLPRSVVRAAGVTLRKKDGPLVERVLVRAGRSLRWLDAKSGRPRPAR